MLHDRQADAFVYADTKKLPVHFKVFPPPGGRDRFASCKTQKGLAKNIAKSEYDRRTCQELLRDGSWLSPYWDIDLYTIDVENLVETRRSIITAFNELCTVVFPMISEKFEPTLCKWSDSSGVVNGKFKVSLHCVYTDPNLAFEYNRAKEGRDKRKALHQFGKLCIRESRNYTALFDGESIIDGSVWSTNRAMRMLGCHKVGDKRVLKPVNTEFEVDDDYTHTDIRQHMIARMQAPARPCRIKESVKLEFAPPVHTDAGLIASVAAEIGCDVDTVSGSLVTLKTRQSGRVCPISGQTYKPGNNRCYLQIKNGEIFYRQHGVEGTKKLASLPTNKQYDMFVRDLPKLLAIYKRTGDEFTVSMVKDFLRDTVILIARAFKPEYIVKVDGYEHGFSISAVNSFKYVSGQDPFGSIRSTMRFRCRVIKQDKNGEDYVAWVDRRVSGVLTEMVDDNDLRTYDECRYVPYCKKEPYIGNNIFNSFVPFSFLSYKPATEVPPFEEHAMYRLMKVELTAGNQVAFDYLLDYIAHKLQKPHIKIETALAFVRTIQGIGKGQWSKWIRILFDDRNCKVVANLDHLFGNFNAHLQNCLWVFLEEIKGRGAAWDQAGRLKDLITADSQMWTKKHHDTEEGRWYGSIVIFSNNSYGIRVETSDRRYVLFDTNWRLRDDKEFHDQVTKETMDADYMATAFQWFLDRDVSKWNWRKIPKTKTRTDVKQACEDVAMTFTRWLFENNTNWSDAWSTGCDLRALRGDYSLVTNKQHLVKRFRVFKEDTGHPTKVHERNAIFDLLKLLWRGQLKAGQFSVNGQRFRGLKIGSVRGLQRALTRHFRDPVILQILQNDTTSS